MDRRIARRGGALYDKFCGFIENLQKLGASLRSSNEEYDEAMKKLHEGRGNLISQAEQLKLMGAKTSKSIPASLLDKAERDGDNEPAMLN